MGDPIEELIARCEADGSLHMRLEGCSEDELRAVESSLGCPLPSSFRLFLRQLGGGIYYLRHEIFGARRVMIHDIELVPDLLSFRTWLGASLPADWLPLHRADGRVHAIALGVGDEAPVRPLDGSGPDYVDFATFFQKVVCP